MLADTNWGSSCSRKQGTHGLLFKLAPDSCQTQRQGMPLLNWKCLLFPGPLWSAEYFWLVYHTFMYPLITTRWSQFSILGGWMKLTLDYNTSKMGYNFTAQWIKGSNNSAPDALSCYPVSDPNTEDTLLFYFHYPTRDLQGSLRLMEQGVTIFNIFT